MSVETVQNYLSRTDSSPWTRTYGAAPAVGNLLVLCVLTDAAIVSVVNGAAAAWTLAVGPLLSGDGARYHIYYRVCTNATDDTTITVTATGAGTVNGMFAEYKQSTGTATWALDGTNSTTGTGTAQAPGSFSVAGSSNVVVGYVNHHDESPTQGSGYTKEQQTGAWQNTAVEDKFTTAPATENPNWTTTASAAWQALGAAFRSDGGGASAFIPLIGRGPGMALAGAGGLAG